MNKVRFRSYKKCIPVLLLGSLFPLSAAGQSASVDMTSEEAESMYTTIQMQRTSVHDPSITLSENNNEYYIFGSHIATAKSKDLENWTWVNIPWGTVSESGATVSPIVSAEAFRTNQTKEITINGQKVQFGNFDAAGWNCAIDGKDEQNVAVPWTVDGNMWAPDIIYNPTMKKWCQYLSLNGPEWNSCIILLTADRIEGPYIYQGPVVFTGFRRDNDERISFHKTDLELVIGSQESLPARYAKEKWGDFWPHAIDPTVFFDENNALWMAYGSWSGGIYMLQLDENTGLRDYDITYPSDFNTLQAKVTSDPYFGKKIAGGCYVSGEGPYIEHIGDYYYLFMSYGGYAPDGGYEMRIFRSENPDGPYTDANGVSAIFPTWKLNFGLNSDTRGEKLLGAYNQWGFMTTGECAQGHNSVLAAPDGNTYLIYHTKFNDGTVGHQVRVHQLFLNRQGWPVAAPFEYHGEKVNDAVVSTTRLFADEDIIGTYQMILHRYRMDHKQYEESEPVQITLHADGTVNGAYTGKWQCEAGNSYLSLTINGEVYDGVVIEQQMEPTTIKAIAFTACNAKGVNIWGYKMQDKYALAYTLNNLKLPFSPAQTIFRNLDLYGIGKANDNVQVRWSSDLPEVISNTGKYNPKGLSENVPVNLTLDLKCGIYHWTQTYPVKAQKETIPSGDYLTGLKAYYSFDQIPAHNAYNTSQHATFKKEGSNKLPGLEEDSARTGNVLHQYFGAAGNCSYTQFANPLRNEALDGLTVSMWVKRTDDIPWDAIWSFYNQSANTRLYLTGNSYIGFNNGADWFDINHPEAILSENIPVGKWTLVTLTVSRQEGCTLYINGYKIRSIKFQGACDGTDITQAKLFDYNLVVDFIRSCPNFYLGYGSFWGSTDVRVDDIMIYNRELTSGDIRALYTMCNRVTDFTIGEGGTDISRIPRTPEYSDETIFDLSGRKVIRPRQGIHIVNGKKKIIR